jgi:hypothetical protein
MSIGVHHFVRVVSLLAHFPAPLQQFGRYRCIANSGKPSARQIYAFTAQLARRIGRENVILVRHDRVADEFALGRRASPGESGSGRKAQSAQ